jgi:hypothetical protein
MMFQACVAQEPRIVQEGHPHVSVQLYECPLIGQDARFVVMRSVCSKYESHAIGLKDLRTGAGFLRNRFAGIDPYFISVESGEGSMPACMTGNEEKP